MGLDLPLWLDKDFLTAALEGGSVQEPRVRVVEFLTSRAAPVGANFLSIPIRVRIDYKVENKEKRISVIVKIPLTSGTIGDVTGHCGHYNKEYRIYNEALPILNDILKCEFGPKRFYSSVKDVLVLEDLKEKGYVMYDRYKQLDFAHCQHVLRKLAQFHAASVSCKKHYPDIIAHVGDEIVYVKNANFIKNITPWIEDSLRATVEAVKELQLGKDAENVFESRVENAAETMVKMYKPKSSGLNVLNHGDLWVNNILFKYTSSGDLLDIMLLDFQSARYASPINDLMYFVWTSANEVVRESRLPELFDLYRVTLNSTLDQLGCEERLSEEEFHQDLKDATDLSVILVGHILPITARDTELVEKSEEKDGTFMNAFGGKDNLFGGKYFRTLLPKVTEHLKTWNEFCH